MATVREARSVAEQDTTLDKLNKRKAEIEERMRRLRARLDERHRKEQDRLRRLIGAAALAAIRERPDLKQAVEAVLSRETTSSRDWSFLVQKGFLKS